MSRAVESGLRGRWSRVCARAVAHRAGGQQWAADAAGQDAILAGAAAKAACILRCDHSNVASFSDARVFADAPPACGSCK